MYIYTKAISDVLLFTKLGKQMQRLLRQFAITFRCYAFDTYTITIIFIFKEAIQTEAYLRDAQAETGLRERTADIQLQSIKSM